jgi:hypothetical protein
MAAYMDYSSGKLEDKSYEEADLQASLADLPRVAAE